MARLDTEGKGHVSYEDDNTDWESRMEACLASVDPERFAPEADAAANFLKALAHDGRLMILCNLANGERSVTELETLLLSRQAAVSQQLARLRMERIVKTRREGKTIYYSLSDPRIARVLGLIYDCFCRQEGSPPSFEG